MNAFLWDDYASGIFTDCSENDDVFAGHAVIIIGYEIEENQGVFVIRNSWGTTEWGEQGYIRLFAERSCGI